MTESQPLLSVSHLDVVYGTGRHAFRAVHDVSLSIGVGETLGLVGESGSGKSSIGRAVLGLAKVASGEIRFDGHDITRASRKRRLSISSDLQVVFQDPRSSLNDVKKIGDILTEPLIANKSMNRRRATERARELLVAVGLDESAMNRMPGSFSGGQRQRIAIARSLMPAPKLIICDEPVSALDLSVQAQIVNLFRHLQEQTGVSYLFIGHDLSIVRLLSDRMAVMSNGSIVEEGPAEQVYSHPREAYTQRLVAAEPYPNPAIQRERRKRWEEVNSPSPKARTTEEART